MSGGSLNYAYHKVEEAADSIRARSNTPLHRAFAQHLLLVAYAMRDIEWVFSGDRAPGEEAETIKLCLAPGIELEQALHETHEIVERLGHLLGLAAAGKTPQAVPKRDTDRDEKSAEQRPESDAGDGFQRDAPIKGK